MNLTILFGIIGMGRESANRIAAILVVFSKVLKIKMQFKAIRSLPQQLELVIVLNSITVSVLNKLKSITAII